ncbi:uncharacterized protein LOC135334987 [Halichondria panicea]|uniref:uncharacterized protein LOC135334987 n=1 Tax=Halichondria panicea TaxID=6063 RepID=UPI00312B7C25
MERRSGRKRHSTDSSVDDLQTKKRKKSSKRDQSTMHDTLVSPPTYSPLPTHSSPSKRKKSSAPVITKPPPPPSASANGGGSAKAGKKKKKKVKEEEEVIEEPVEQAAAEVQTEVQTKPKRKGKAFYLKPANGSWSKHVGSLVMYRAVSQALMMETDPRENEATVNWNMMSAGFISAKDLELIWCLIKKEFPGKSLTAIRDELKPYTAITTAEVNRAGVREQFKSEFPKAPPTPYMLFVRIKTAAMRAKHPGIKMMEIAKKLGAKWQSIGTEKQDKYRQQYQDLKVEYKAKLADFYSHHPDAKVPTRMRSKAKDDDSLTPEEKRIKELKAFLPKPPPSAYMLFCKAKRSKVQKQHPELNSKQITLKLSMKWKDMISTQQAKYKESYDNEKRRHKEQMKIFHETYPDAKDLLSKGKKSKSEDTSTQTSMVATPGRPLHVINEETDYDTSSSEGEEESEGGVAQGGVVVPSESEKSDTEQLSDEHSPVPKSAVAIFNSKSRDKSPDSILTSDDSSDSDQ